MNAAREYFSALFGCAPQPFSIYDRFGCPVWQNAAADACYQQILAIDEDALMSDEVKAAGMRCMAEQAGVTLEGEKWKLFFFPQSFDGEAYYALQPQLKGFDSERERLLCILRSCSARLNNYLNSIYAQAQLLGLDTPVGERLGKEVRHILRMSNHLYQLLDRSGTKEYKIPIALDAFLEEYHRSAMENYPHLQLKLEPVEKGQYIRIMPEYMELVLSMLVSNAHRFAGGIITLRGKRKGDRISISVEDCGPGVAEPERLFEWGCSSQDLHGKKGLGFSLAAARELMEFHGGALRYERQNDRSVFELLLDAEELPEGTRLAEWIAEPPENTLSRLRIELSDIE